MIQRLLGSAEAGKLAERFGVLKASSFARYVAERAWERGRIPEPDAVIDGRYHGWLDVTVASWLIERGAGPGAHAILLGRSWAPKRRPSDALAALLRTEGSAEAPGLREEIVAISSSLDASDAGLVLALARRLKDEPTTDARRTPCGEDP